MLYHFHTTALLRQKVVIQLLQWMDLVLLVAVERLYNEDFQLARGDIMSVDKPITATREWEVKKQSPTWLLRQDKHLFLNSTLFSKRRWTTGSPKTNSQTCKELYHVFLLFLLGFATNTTAYHLCRCSLHLLLVKRSMTQRKHLLQYKKENTQSR